MRDIKPFVSKIKKLLGKNKARPLLLVMFLIVMLSFCYKNQNKVQAVGNSLFEGFKEGAAKKESESETVTSVVGADGGAATEAATTVDDKFRGKRESGLFKRRRRDGLEGSDAKDDDEAFRGRRRGFLGKRLGFRGKKEGMREGATGLEAEPEAEPEDEEDAFRGRRSGFLGKRLGFRGKKEGMGSVPSKKQVMSGGEPVGYSSVDTSTCASVQGFRGRRR